MEQDPELSYTTYMSAADHIALHGLRSDASVAEVPLRHTLISGTSQGSMIATIGHSPHSLIIINDWHVAEQQLVEFTCLPRAVAINAAQDTIAVVSINGLLSL